jgi:hypothetical protein
MNRSHLIIGTLVGLHVVLAVLVLWRFETLVLWRFETAARQRDVGPLDVSLFMLFPSQGSLLGLWTALGGKRMFWRIVITVVGLVACLALCDYYSRSGYRNFGGLVLALVWAAVTTGVSLLLGRLTGLRLSHAGSERGDGELGRFQFSLWQMLTWTTVLAVVLSAIHYLPYNLQPDFRFNPMLAWYVVVFGSVALASIWLAFGRKWLAARVVLLVAITMGLPTVMPLWHLMSRPYAWAATCLLLLAMAAWTTASLLVVRCAGYELTCR